MAKKPKEVAPQDAPKEADLIRRERKSQATPASEQPGRKKRKAKSRRKKSKVKRKSPGRK